MPLTELARQAKITEIKEKLEALRKRELSAAEQKLNEDHTKRVMEDRGKRTNESYGQEAAEAWAKVAALNKEDTAYKGYDTFLSGMLAVFHIAEKLGVALSASFKLKIVQAFDALAPVEARVPDHAPAAAAIKYVGLVQLKADNILDMDAMKQYAYRSDGHALTGDEQASFEEAVKLWLDKHNYNISNDNGAITPQAANILAMTPEIFERIRDHEQDGLAVFLRASFDDALEANIPGPRP